MAGLNTYTPDNPRESSITHLSILPAHQLNSTLTHYGYH